MYSGSIRPVAEYASVILHAPNAHRGTNKKIERQQNQALKFVFGHGLSARKMRERDDIETLEKRRVGACLKFARKTVNNPRCTHWYKKGNRRANVNHRTVKEIACRTARCFNSPVYYYRRLLNEFGAE